MNVTKHEASEIRKRDPPYDLQVNTLGESKAKEDHKWNYHCARLKYGFLIEHQDHTVKGGDAGRFLDCVKVALLLLHCRYRVKYAYVVTISGEDLCNFTKGHSAGGSIKQVLQQLGKGRGRHSFRLADGTSK